MTSKVHFRREVVGAGTLPAAASASPASVARSSDRTTEALRDPAEKYPKPPFKKQSQPWPGLASQMDPPPDHGEKSYRGTARLAGRKALITGGDSGMGGRRQSRSRVRVPTWPSITFRPRNLTRGKSSS
jgi:hypothetical protein